MAMRATGTPPRDYDRLVENYIRVARENAELREENNNLIKAVDNLDSANKKISNELNDIRWEFMRYQEQIRELMELNVSVEVE